MATNAPKSPKADADKEEAPPVLPTVLVEPEDDDDCVALAEAEEMEVAAV